MPPLTHFHCVLSPIQGGEWEHIGSLGAAGLGGFGLGDLLGALGLGTGTVAGGLVSHNNIAGAAAAVCALLWLNQIRADSYMEHLDERTSLLGGRGFLVSDTLSGLPSGTPKLL